MIISCMERTIIAGNEPGEPTVNDHSGEEIAPEAEQGEARVDIGEAEGEPIN